ncbi:hypothetical protein AAMO2058_001015100 [Amorphochlora amoebiformis]
MIISRLTIVALLCAAANPPPIRAGIRSGGKYGGLRRAIRRPMAAVGGAGPPSDLVQPLSPVDLTDDREWIQFQQEKRFADQPKLADSLPLLPAGSTVDAVVVGVGPAGMALAAELGARGLDVGLVGPDHPFTNNYGVWVDEFERLGFANCLVEEYVDSIVVTDESTGPQNVGRRYGRVGRKELRNELLTKCQKTGKVSYYPGFVERAEKQNGGLTFVEVNGGVQVWGKVVVMSTGHNREILEYEKGEPPLWQTAYGIEVDMDETEHPWEVDKAVFMDLTQSDEETGKDLHRVPSFLYVLPSKDKIFLEETCLVSEVQMPFDELKRRLYRRLEKMGIEISQTKIIEEEASWIPLGGTLPKIPQPVLGFGAAAGLVHPASGYSIANSLGLAGPVADVLTEGIRNGDPDPARRAWVYLWSQENRRKMAFYTFGSALIAKLPSSTLKEFMRAFYALPPPLWEGFLASSLPSPFLVGLALAMWGVGDMDLKVALLRELFSPSGLKLFKDATAPVMREDAGMWLGLSRSEPRQEPLHGVFRRAQLQTTGPSGYIAKTSGKS